MNNINFESTKTMAGVGSVLLLLSMVPYAGWVLGIVGIVLLMKSMREFADYYHDESIYQNAWTGIKYYIVAIVAIAVAGTALVLGIASATAFTFNIFTLTAGFGVGLIACLAGLVTAFVFYVLAASHLRKTLNTISAKSGDQSLNTAGTLLWVGSILTIIGVGLVLIFIAWIFAVIGFFGMKNPQFPQYSQTQPYNCSPPQQPAQPINPQATA